MATIFRPPIIVTITPRQKAKESWEVNVRVLYAPNPAVPFNQLDWPLATRARAKATGEVFAAPRVLYSPNPSQPFHQDDWPNPVRQRPTQESDAPAFFIPPKPFGEASWPAATRLRPPAKLDDFVNLLPLQSFVVVTLPFNQFDWPSAAPAKRAAKVDSVFPLLPLLLPGTPFVGLSESRPAVRPKAIVDFVANLLPLQAAPIVVPFSLTDWSTVAKRKPPAIVDLIERSLPLLAPNPAAPFIQPIMMNLLAAKRAAAIVDVVENLLPVQNPPPPPGHVFEWLTRARRRGRR